MVHCCSDASRHLDLENVVTSPTSSSWWHHQVIIIIIQKICSAHIHVHCIHPAGCSRRDTGASPFSFMISVLGSFMCITQHTGPTALRPIRRTKQLWLSVLLRDTSATIGQAGIQTHILTTPELESNALDRSATTLYTYWHMYWHHMPLTSPTTKSGGLYQVWTAVSMKLLSRE